MNPEELANIARDSLSDYCINECKAKCCRVGFLLLKPEELGLFKDGIIKELPEIVNDKTHSVDLRKGCTNLKENKCVIHKDSKRPKTCSNYPIFIRPEKTILVASTCEGVQNNMLYPFLAEFKREGYTIAYTKK
jgi:Fe-S-cluster containining protein